MAKTAPIVLSAAGALFLAWLAANAPSSRTYTANGKPVTPKPKAAPPPPAAKPSTSTKPAPASKWEKETAAAVRLSPDRQYAATIQLSGIEAMASFEAVAEKLAELWEWDPLDVFEFSSVPRGWPGTPPHDESGRYWALGIPAKGGIVARPEQIEELWSRAISRPV